ncbi:MAG: hypothetical protein F6K32_02055 [Desertifilum sp. SIO1I2]|nr:hypothetical protein [Desertifilum sp. SIO1I2]
MDISPKTIYHNLRWLDSVDIATSAAYRQLAQDAIADSEISLTWRQAISDRLNRANHLLAMLTVGGEDSY